MLGNNCWSGTLRPVLKASWWTKYMQLACTAVCGGKLFEYASHTYPHGQYLHPLIPSSPPLQQLGTTHPSHSSRFLQDGEAVSRQGLCTAMLNGLKGRATRKQMSQQPMVLVVDSYFAGKMPYHCSPSFHVKQPKMTRNLAHRRDLL